MAQRRNDLKKERETKSKMTQFRYSGGEIERKNPLLGEFAPRQRGVRGG